MADNTTLSYDSLTRATAEADITSALSKLYLDQRTYLKGTRNDNQRANLTAVFDATDVLRFWIFPMAQLDGALFKKLIMNDASAGGGSAPSRDDAAHLQALVDLFPRDDTVTCALTLERIPRRMGALYIKHMRGADDRAPTHFEALTITTRYIWPLHGVMSMSIKAHEVYLASASKKKGKRVAVDPQQLHEHLAPFMRYIEWSS